VEPFVVAFIALAAVLHAAWNILLKTAGDPLWTATVGLAVSSAVLVPLVAVGWLVAGQPSIPAEAWVIGIVSGGVEVAYFVFLAAAYRRGDLSVVYPMARGARCSRSHRRALANAPRLARGPASRCWSLGCSAATVAVRRRPRRDDRPAAAFASATGAMIATHSDRWGP
jgi:hypothetical protein